MEQKKKGHKAVFGIFKTRSSVDSAVEMLKSKGFKNSDISVLMPSEEGTKKFNPNLNRGQNY